MTRYAVTVNHPTIGDLELAAELAEREAAALARQQRHLARFFAWRVEPLAQVH